MLGLEHFLFIASPTQTQMQMEQEVDMQLIQQREQDIRKLEVIGPSQESLYNGPHSWNCNFTFQEVWYVGK